MGLRYVKIRTLLLISSFLLLAVSSVIGGVVYRTTVRTNSLLMQNTQADVIIADAYQLKVLAQEYISYYEDRPREQWYLQHRRLRERITSDALNASPSAAYVPELLAAADAIKRSFDALTSRAVEAKDNPFLERQLVGDVLIGSEALISKADDLTTVTQHEGIQARADNDRLIFGLLLGLALLANAIILVLYHRIIGSISRLQRGTQIVGRGDLNYKLSNGDDSEIGQLSRAFDVMTQKLKQSYDNLENKVIERTRDLERLSRKNEILLRSIGDGVMVIDANWNITFWNDAAYEISGWKPEEAVGRPFREIVRFVRSGDRTENIEFIRQAMSLGQGRTMENDTLMIRKDGSAVPVGDSVAPVFDGEGGRVTGAIIVFRDVSVQHELKDKEAQIAKIKDDFLFRTIHDLRAPTNNIRLALDVHSEEEAKVANPALAHTTAMIRDASTRMEKLIDDLLEIAKGEQAEVHLRKDPLDMVALTKSAIDECLPYMNERGVSVEHVAAKSLPKVIGDADALKEVLVNLLNNATKYNRKNGSITVTQNVEGGFLRTAVRDTGIGVPKESVDKLFTPYFRAVGKDIPGTGLGLYIVKKLIDKMDGKISVETSAGNGTTFTFVLTIEHA